MSLITCSDCEQHRPESKSKCFCKECFKRREVDRLLDEEEDTALRHQLTEQQIISNLNEAVSNFQATIINLMLAALQEPNANELLAELQNLNREVASFPHGSNLFSEN